jgi:ATP-binding cassette subfamily F protein 3
LDFQSVNILIQALQQYEGTFVTVSHDRHFIKGVANKIWYIENHEIKEYPGTYDEYEVWKLNQVEVKSSEPVVKAQKKEPVPISQNTMETQLAKKELKKLEEQLAKIESEIVRLESEKQKLELKMADPSLYSNESESNTIQEKYQFIQSNVLGLNKEWENLVDQISSLQEVIA